MTDVQTDTPINLVRSPPVSRLELAKAFIGDLARPFALIVSSAGAVAAMIIMACKVNSFEGAAAFMGAIGLYVGGMYGFKAWEVREGAKAASHVEVAKAQAGATP